MRIEEIGYSSVKGSLHERENIPNQDSYSVKRYRFGTVLVVSDGLGSKKHSDIGSKSVGKAVDRAVQIWNGYERKDIRLLLPLIIAIWNMEIFPYSQKDCGATCLFAVICKDGNVYIGQLGDGAIYVAIGGRMQLVSEKEDDFTNLTVCMGNFSGYADWTLKQFQAGEELLEIVLMTDGVSETIIEEKKEKFVRLLLKKIALLDNLPKRNQFVCKLLSEWNPVNAGDDRTLICYRRR